MRKIREICWKDRKTKIVIITGIVSILLLIIIFVVIALNYQNNLKATQAQILIQEEAQEEVDNVKSSMKK